MALDLFFADSGDRDLIQDVVDRPQDEHTIPTAVYGPDDGHDGKCYVVVPGTGEKGHVYGIKDHYIPDPSGESVIHGITEQDVKVEYASRPLFNVETPTRDGHQNKLVVLTGDVDANETKPVEAMSSGLCYVKLKLPLNATYKAASISDTPSSGTSEYLKADNGGDIPVFHHAPGEADEVVDAWVLLGGGSGSDTSALGIVQASQNPHLQDTIGPVTVKWAKALPSQDMIDAINDEELRSVTNFTYETTHRYAVHLRPNYLRGDVLYAFLQVEGIWYVDNQLSFIEYQ